MELNDLLLVFLGTLLTAGIVSVALAVFILRRVRVQLREGASTLEALRATPLSVAIFLDVLDLALDGFGAPIAWWVLGKVGLGKLRGVAVVESLLPGTQVIPTMTAAWVIGRVLPARGGERDPATIDGCAPYLPSPPSG